MIYSILNSQTISTTKGARNVLRSASASVDIFSALIEQLVCSDLRELVRSTVSLVSWARSSQQQVPLGVSHPSSNPRARSWYVATGSLLQALTLLPLSRRTLARQNQACLSAHLIRIVDVQDLINSTGQLTYSVDLVMTVSCDPIGIQKRIFLAQINNEHLT